MLRITLYACALLLMLAFLGACTAWQPTKEVWKTTKGLWNTYVSPPASVDYEDKGDVSPEARALSESLMGVDAQLTRLERVMQNADKPPTQAWLADLFAQFPWLNGFAGVRYDGTVLGQEPPDSIKQLDFIPLLYEDKKQNSRALRADVQPSPLGAEIMLATPLYDGVDFLGIVVSYFDMRNLMKYSTKADDIVVLCPGALLWPGKYDFAATPLAGVDWEKAVRESSAGTCSNATGSFYYMVRYLGNMPLVFAVPSKGTFPGGNGSLEQGTAFFPQEREKMPPPELPERKRDTEAMMKGFQPEPEPEPEPAPQPPAQPVPEPSERHVIKQGSRESLLLKQRQAEQRRIQERLLEEMPAPQPEPDTGPTLQLIPDSAKPGLSGGRPSPFGPHGGQGAEPADQEPAASAPETDTPESGSPDAAGINAPSKNPHADAPRLADGEAAPVQESAAKPAAPAAPETKAPEAAGINAPSELPPADAPRLADGEAEPTPEVKKPATLPGGRPSPFGPRN